MKNKYKNLLCDIKQNTEDLFSKIIIFGKEKTKNLSKNQKITVFALFVSVVLIVIYSAFPSKNFRYYLKKVEGCQSVNMDVPVPTTIEESFYRDTNLRKAMQKYGIEKVGFCYSADAQFQSCYEKHPGKDAYCLCYAVLFGELTGKKWGYDQYYNHLNMGIDKRKALKAKKDIDRLYRYSDIMSEFKKIESKCSKFLNNSENIANKSGRVSNNNVRTSWPNHNPNSIAYAKCKSHEIIVSNAASFKRQGLPINVSLNMINNLARTDEYLYVFLREYIEKAYANPGLIEQYVNDDSFAKDCEEALLNPKKYFYRKF